MDRVGRLFSTLFGRLNDVIVYRGELGRFDTFWKEMIA